MDRLLVLSAMPLVAVVVTICWQLTAAPSPAIQGSLTEQPVAASHATQGIDAVLSPVLPTEEGFNPTNGSTPPATPMDPIEREPMPTEPANYELPILPTQDSSIHPTSARQQAEEFDLRSADCRQDDEPIEPNGMDHNIVRIESVRSMPTTGARRSVGRIIPAPRDAQECDDCPNQE